MEANGQQTKHFSDLIEDSYKKWNDTRVILDGGTGTGKSYFILNILSKYADTEGKRVLYLCNRSPLKEKIYHEAKEMNLLETVTVITYQKLADLIQKKEPVPDAEYVVADECHYFTEDALFNEYTDIAYSYIKRLKGRVVIYMSATCKVFFRWMRKSNHVTDEHYFYIPKSYEYVDELYFYEKKYLIPKVDDILEKEEDSKIIIFCNSIQQMIKLHEKYGDKACYFASKNAKKVSDIRTENCIQSHEDGTVTFDKRILVATKVLDNGIDIKDKKVKHIFSEILDVDSAIQALGRKRKMSDDDTCTFYLKDYTGQALQGRINRYDYQIDPVNKFRKDYRGFLETYAKDRKRLRNNKIFHTEFAEKVENSKFTYNRMRLKKYYMDYGILTEMRETTYNVVMLELLGSELAAKAKKLDIYVEEKDEFMDYIKSIEGKWLYTDDKEIVKKNFEKIGLKLRYKGVNTFNGALEDNYPNYECRFRDKIVGKDKKLTSKYLTDKRRKLSDGTDNPNRDRKYWILERKHWISE